MDIQSVLLQYDKMFGNTPLEQIEEFLYNKITEAISLGDDSAIITLLNEMLGLCRDTSQKEKALAYAAQLKVLLDKMGLEGTESYATSMQPIWTRAVFCGQACTITGDFCIRKWANMNAQWLSCLKPLF